MANLPLSSFPLFSSPPLPSFNRSTIRSSSRNTYTYTYTRMHVRGDEHVPSHGNGSWVVSSSCGSSCTCTHPRTIEFYHVEHRDPLVLSSFVTRRHLSPFIRLHYIYAHHDIYTYNVQTTRNPPVFSGTRSSTRTRTRTPSSFRCVASIEIERSPSPSRARQYDFEELETKRKTLLLSPDFLRNFLSNFNAYIYIFIN